MFRHLTTLALVTTLTLASFGCDKKPQQPRQQPPAETGAEEPLSDADQPDADQPDAEQAAECPKARDYQGMCAQVITWAQNPDTGQCCQYGSPCEAPEKWQTFTSEADCAQAGGQTSKGGE